MSGKLISFEGIDGSGKSTQIALLAQWLASHNIPHVITKEPGGTPLGSAIRDILLHRDDLAISPLAETFLFQADRAQHFADVVLPALESGKVVVTDRCLDSNFVYQGGRQFKLEALIFNLSMIATQHRLPDMTLLLDIEPVQVFDRMRGKKQDRFEQDNDEMIKRRGTYHMLAATCPERIKLIDASQSIDIVHQAIVRHVERLLGMEVRRE